MNNYEICDVHSHFLPGMDDGCKDAGESLRLLELSRQQGVAAMFATPHYYPVESVADFLKRRQAAMDRLQRQLDEKGSAAIPRFCLGAEVAFRPGLHYEEDLEKLCLGNSRYLLLELPFTRWSDSLVREVSNICNTRGIIPVLAHINRYLDPQNRPVLEKLLDQDVLVQMNNAPLCRFGSRRKAAKLVKFGTVQLLGSDSHNLTDRSPNMAQAMDYLDKKGLQTQLRQICRESLELFYQATR